MSNNKFKVLIIEDEANICSFLVLLASVSPQMARTMAA